MLSHSTIISWQTSLDHRFISGHQLSGTVQVTAAVFVHLHQLLLPIVFNLHPRILHGLLVPQIAYAHLLR